VPPSDEPFAALRHVQDVLKIVRPMAEHMARHRPEVRELTIMRRDRETLMRYPKAASLPGVQLSTQGTLMLNHAGTNYTLVSRHDPRQ
jgi:hypothetical protein